MDIIFHSANNLPVGQRKSDGYVDATAMCKAYYAKTGKRREVSEWLKNKRTQQTLEHLSTVTGIPVTALYQVVQGGNEQSNQGTWIHHRLAIRFGIWLDDDFGFMVEEWIATWMTTGQNPVAQPQPQPQTPPSSPALPSFTTTADLTPDDEHYQRLKAIACDEIKWRFR